MASHSDAVDGGCGDVLLEVVALLGVPAGLSGGRTSVGRRAASVGGGRDGSLPSAGVRLGWYTCLRPRQHREFSAEMSLPWAGLMALYGH